MSVEKIRKICVTAFIVVGLACIPIEMANAPKVYEGIGDGFDSEIKVSIKAKKNSKGEVRISEIKCMHGDTEVVAGPALEEMMTQLKSKQDIDALDTVAGATYSCEGFIMAVEDAVSKIEE